MDERVQNVGMYVIDKEYRILNCNNAMRNMYPEVKVGDICHKALALNDSPCAMCPLVNNNVLFFNPFRKEWISANAAEIEYPEHGLCYNIQFKMQKNVGGTKAEVISMEKVDEHLYDLKTLTGTECVIGAYCEPGSPLFYANENMVRLLGYDTLEDMLEGTDGLMVNIVHMYDRQRVHSDINHSLSVGETFETFFRIPQKDGSWIWTVTRGKIVKTSTGKKATLAVCAGMDNFLKIHDSLEEKTKELIKDQIETESLMNKIPGAYHRCLAKDGYPFQHISESFEEVVGWTRQEIEEELDNKFINLIWQEDLYLFDNLLEQIENRGQGSSIYRIKSKNGGFKWVQDSTMFVDAGEDSFYQCTLADITAYVEELEDAKKRAEVSNRAKSAFLFNASHDIRTPMNAIQGFTQILKENVGDAEIVRETVAKIEKSGNILMKLLNNVLELSRIESGKEDVDIKATDLDEFSNRLKTVLAEEIEKRGIVFELKNKISDKNVLCDELKLTQIAMNMISNAKKFTSEGGSITFGVEQITEVDNGAAEYKFYVKDTGIGMSEQFLSRAFEQFERERTTTESGVIGSGLGLSIIKKLTELMGGTCTLVSEVGKGTEIYSVLKLYITDDVVKEIKKDRRIIDVKGKRILLVEDNDFNREIARFVLEKQGIIVDEAENGAIAIEMLCSQEAGFYDLVLMDIQMPVMDGYTATKEIRNNSNPLIAQIPIVAMTANAFKEDRDRCLEVGMNEHISKPVEIYALTDVVSRIFG